MNLNNYKTKKKNNNISYLYNILHYSFKINKDYKMNYKKKIMNNHKIKLLKYKIKTMFKVSLFKEKFKS